MMRFEEKPCNFFSNPKNSGQTSFAFYLGARLDANSGSWRWTTAGNPLLPDNHPAWFPGFPADPADPAKRCIYAFIAADVDYDRSWAAVNCNQETRDFVCELDNPE